MTKKQERIIEYIQNLPAGTKISTRSIADAMSVSTGTAYKAIKTAEAQALVETRPRAGTFRIAKADTVEAEKVTFDHLIARLGLAVLARGQDKEIQTVVVGDGSLEQILKSRTAAEGSALCIIGHRPELYSVLLQSRFSLLITGGAPVEDDAAALAERMGLYILSSQQSSAAILPFVLSNTPCRSETATTNGLDVWTRKPAYLYYNDLVSDWYRVYESCLTPVSQYAVVDDEQRICGSVDIKDILTAQPFENIDRLCREQPKKACCIIPWNMSMDAAAEKMIQCDSGVAFAVKDGRLSGILTANDVLRYYVCGAYRTQDRPAVIKVRSCDKRDDGTTIYRVQGDTSGISSQDELLELCAAPGLHAAGECIRSFMDGDYAVKEMKWYAFSWEGETGALELAVSPVEKTAGCYVVDMLVYDEKRRYIKMTITYSCNAELPAEPRRG